MDDKSYYDKISTTSSSLYDIAVGHDNNNDRYTDMEEIGEGVVKKINRVLDLTSGRLVAMAVPQKNLSKEQLQRFLEEARLTASLEHSNIMQVYDLGFNQEGNPYFTMKLCSSQKFTDLIADTSTSLFQLLDIFLRVCDAVSYAHNAGAVHRDIKPENILLGNFGEVLLCDWGSAQILPGSILENEVGQLSKPLTKGSPGFMAPEQSTADSPSTSQDIYTLGAILYQILTRKAPEPDNKLRPSEIRSEIPSGLEAVCLKAMSQNPEDRYQSVDDLRKEIKAWLSGYATQAEDAPFHKQLKLMIVRHKGLSISILASLIIISCLSLFYINNLKEKEHQTRSQRDRAEKALELYDLEKESRKKIAALGA
ncbi:MAG: serine/threonine protein kinase, partial [Lentisphaeraceae bacterium]|nr:serine/threonine protein kinase [Lentisphaeraceae bacterium]